MKQRFLPVLLSALCLTIFLTIPLHASNTQVNGIWYNFNSANHTAAITYRGYSYDEYKEYSGTITIPSTVTYKGVTYQVTSISDDAFRNCSGLTSISIPNSITTIGCYAFSFCSGLTSVIIPNSVTNIEGSAFSYCSGVVFVTIGNGVTSISESAFSGCSELKTITIGENVTRIASGVFNSCNKLTSIQWNAKNYTSNFASYDAPFHDLRSQITSFTFGESVQSIPDYLCYGMQGLKSIAIPTNVTNIGTSTFAASNITSVNWNAKSYYLSSESYSPFYKIRSQITSFFFGMNVQIIPNYLCYGMANLTSVNVSVNNGVLGSIGSYAFYNCGKLNKITIYNDIKSIGKYAFSGCSSLISFNLSDIITKIEEGTFRNCSGLSSITIPNSVTSIGYGAFSDCSGLTSVSISEGVTSIGGSAFYGCSGLTSVSIPEGVTSIGGSAFYGCSGLKEVHIADITKWCTMSFGSWHANPLYYANNLYVNGSLVTDLVIPKGVTSIGEYAFYGCSGLHSVTIPNSVTSIGNSVFEGCKSLNTIVWDAESCSSSSIETNAPFYDLRQQITSFTFGESVQSIPDYLCYGMQNLTSISIPVNVIHIGNYAFSGCSGLHSVTIPNSVTSIGNSIFEGCKSLNTIVWDAESCSSSSIETNAPFYDIRQQITSFTFGESVQSIPDYLCYGMQNLTSISIPVNVIHIGNYAFFGCSSLTSVNIPDGVEGIGYEAFLEVTNIRYNGIATGSPWGAKTINGYIDGFLIYSDSLKTRIMYCSDKATNIIIPESVKSIDSLTFSECSMLKEIVWNAESCSSSSIQTNAPFYDIRQQITSFTFGESVQSIPKYLCYGMENLTSVTIPNSVTNIEDYAFSYCSSLTSVTIGSSVISIGYAAFSGCSGLTSVSIPEGVTSIGGSAFNNCSGLTSVSIPNSVTSIQTFAFTNCSGLTSITIPNSVTYIFDYTFAGCGALTSVTIPNSVTRIGDAAFSGCGLISITIPNSVTSIEDYAFYGCTNLTSVTIPNSVTSIGVAAFAYCSEIDSVTIGNNVTSIGNFAFYGCSSLNNVVWNVKNSTDYYYSETPFRYYNNDYPSDNFDIGSQITSFTFGDDVEYIPNFLCCGMINIPSITIPNSVTGIGEYAFYDVQNIIYGGNASGSPWGAKSINYLDGFLVYSDSTKKDLLKCISSATGEIIIPSSVISIKESAFKGCSGITSVTIGENITSIGKDAFSGCSGLSSVTLNSKTIVSNNYTSSSSIKDIFGTQVKEYIIGESVTSIGDNAFHGCTGLTSVTIPESVETTGKFPFDGCSNLTSVTWNAINCTTYDDGKYVYPPFQGCENITTFTIGENVQILPRGLCYGMPISSIVIPDKVINIGDNAFRDCIGLTSVTIPNSVTSIGHNAFNDCSSLTSITIPESVETIGSFPFEGCSNLTSVTWNAINCTTDDDGQYVFPPFQGCENITTFTIGENVQSLPRGLCYGLPITSITIPSKVTDIGDAAFSDCSSLTSVTIPNSVTSIGAVAFRDCKGLTSVTIGNGVTSIGGWAFYGCSELTDVIIPNKVTDLGESAFEDCTNLTTLTLGESITNYGDSVFNDCPKLTTIYNYRERPAKLGKGVFADVDYFNCTLHVLAGSVDMYKSSGSDWKDFYFVEPIGAASTTTEKVEITPTDNTAGFVWPTVNNAASYELVIKDKQGNDVCTLIFDAQGHLTQIAFAAPDRNRAPEQTAEQVAGFSFTITGLNSGTTYHYTITSKDSNGNTLDTKTGTFRTQGGTATTYTLTVYSADATLGIVSGSGEYEDGEEVTITATPADGYRFVRWSDDNTDNPRTIVLTEDMTFTAYFERIPDALEETDTDRAPRATKVFENGQLYILLPDNTRYDLQGMEVK